MKFDNGRGKVMISYGKLSENYKNNVIFIDIKTIAMVYSYEVKGILVWKKYYPN